MRLLTLISPPQCLLVVSKTNSECRPPPAQNYEAAPQVHWNRGLFLILGPVPMLILKLVRVLVFDSMVSGS